MPPHLERNGTTSTISSNTTLTHLEGDALGVGHDGAMNMTPATGHEQTQPTKYSNKRSWDYVLKTGAAGGLAGCAVSFNGPNRYMIELIDIRLKLWLVHLTESRSFSKLQARNSQNTVAHGLGSSLQYEI